MLPFRAVTNFSFEFVALDYLLHDMRLYKSREELRLMRKAAAINVRAHLRAMGMKTDLRDIPGDLPDADALIALMAQDKKVLDGKLRFILARDIGDAFVTADVPKGVLQDVLKDALAAR